MPRAPFRMPSINYLRDVDSFLFKESKKPVFFDHFFSRIDKINEPVVLSSRSEAYNGANTHN